MAIHYVFLFEDKHDDYREVLVEPRSAKARLLGIREQRQWEQNHFRCATHILLSGLVDGSGIGVLKEIKKIKKNIYASLLRQKGQESPAGFSAIRVQGNPYHAGLHDEDD